VADSPGHPVTFYRPTHRLGDDQPDLRVGGLPTVAAGMYDEIRLRSSHTVLYGEVEV
jgi:hypothetical protein